MATVPELHNFQKFVLNFYHRYGRHTLPWRQDYLPYKVLVSEIMLQQTQVDRVIPKFEKFLQAFPNFNALATASQSEVLKHWVGLGYNRRALNLHKAAQQVVNQFEGYLPQNEASLLALAGIGPYTAAALQSFAFNLPSVVIETNIRTVFIYHFFPEQEKVTDADLLPLIKQTLDKKEPREWYSALMDYGTYLKKSLPNPSRKSMHYTKQSTFKGSVREARGAVLKALVHNPQIEKSELLSSIKLETEKLQLALSQLQSEGFIILKDEKVSLK